MRKIWSALLVVGLSLSPLVAKAESLTDALIAAYRNSHLLEQNQAVLRAADEDLATAVGTLLPVFSWELGVNATSSFFTVESFGRIGQQDFNFSDTLRLVASMPIYDFGRNKLNIAIKNELVMAAQQSLVNIEQQVLFDAVAAYVNMSLQNQLVAAQEANVRLITRDLQAARDRFDVGEVTRTDVALAEAQLAAARAALAASQGSVNVAREEYKASIGHYPGALSPLPAWKSAAKTVEAARAIALRNHPVILQSQHQVKAADLGMELAKAQMLPTISGNVTLSQTYSDRTSGPISESIGVQASQTIYAGGRLSSGYRQAIAQSQSAHAALMQTNVNVSQAVGQAWSNILVSNASIHAGDEQIRAAQAAYDGVKQEAELGSRTTLDVMSAEQQLLSAKAARLQAAANLYTSQYQLLSAMGLLTASHLKLGIPVFDPSAYLNAVKNAPATSARGAKLDKILKSLGK